MSEIKQLMKENLERMEELIRKQKFNVVDAQKIMETYFNVYRRMEQLEESRNNWRTEAERLLKLLKEGKNE